VCWWGVEVVVGESKKRNASVMKKESSFAVVSKPVGKNIKINHVCIV
jgi:hypothetical protein